MTDKDDETMEGLNKKIDDFVSNYEPENVDGELGEWYNYSTNRDEEKLNTLTIKNGELLVIISKQYTTYVDSED